MARWPYHLKKNELGELKWIDDVYAIGAAGWWLAHYHGKGFEIEIEREQEEVEALFLAQPV